MTREEIDQIEDIIHKTIYKSFDVCDDNEEVSMTKKDKLLLEVNKAICNNIKPLEQEPKTEWTHVNEGLPERSGEYLVSVIDEYDGNYEAVRVAWFAHKKNYKIEQSEWRELGIDETVIAWMPLPEPYREVEQ